MKNLKRNKKERLSVFLNRDYEPLKRIDRVTYGHAGLNKTGRYSGMVHLIDRQARYQGQWYTVYDSNQYGAFIRVNGA